MLEHVPVGLVLVVAGIILMVVVVVALTDWLERRRSKRRDRSDTKV